MGGGVRMKRIIDWLKKGGGKFIGFDDCGNRMYSVSNGDALFFTVTLGASVVCLFVILKSLCQLW